MVIIPAIDSADVVDALDVDVLDVDVLDVDVLDVDDVLSAFQSLEIHNTHIAGLVAADLGVGGTDVRALLFISRNAEVTPKQTAEFLELTTGATTNLIDRMVAAGLITRGPHPRDRRSILLHVAPTGFDAVQRLSDFYRRAFRDALDATQLAALADGFRAIGAALARTAENDRAEDGKALDEASAVTADFV